MLCGKLAVVTGAGSGIGRAICQIVAREGATVAAADRNFDSAQKTVTLLDGSRNGQHIGLLMDVTSQESVAAALATICEKYNKPPTCVVNCAGIITYHPIAEMTQEDFMNVIDVNLKGTFLVTKLTTVAMMKSGLAGSVVNISSMSGKCGDTYVSHYCASKAGIDGFTRAIAKELGPKNIRCNVVLPGTTDTPMLDKYCAAHPSENLKEEILESNTMRRLGKPEEVAELVAFLLSDRASYMTGASVECSGCYTG